MIQAAKLSISYGTQVLFDDVAFTVNAGERIGLVGRNGHGKTTLFRMITGEVKPDAGVITIPNNYTIGYLSQHLAFTEDAVLGEGCLGLMPSDDGRDESYKVETILIGLGFTEDDFLRHPLDLSGGYEATARLTYLDPSELLRKAGSIGKAIPGVRITLSKEDGAPAGPGEVGEIVAEGENVMEGYWNSPGDTAAVLVDGRLHTGDLAFADEEGFLYVIGRRSEMIKTAGHRASPVEIEEVISGIPGVQEVAVIGIPDEVLGQAIRAFVVCGTSEVVSRNDILKHCSKNLEAFLVPHDVSAASSISF